MICINGYFRRNHKFLTAVKGWFWVGLFVNEKGHFLLRGPTPSDQKMASATEYSAKQLNYYRICYVATDILPEGLRSIFKQEWDNLYTATMGEWVDEPRNGMDFFNAESLRNQRRLP